MLNLRKLRKFYRSMLIKLHIVPGCVCVVCGKPMYYDPCGLPVCSSKCEAACFTEGIPGRV